MELVWHCQRCRATRLGKAEITWDYMQTVRATSILVLLELLFLFNRMSLFLPLDWTLSTHRLGLGRISVYGFEVGRGCCAWFLDLGALNSAMNAGQITPGEDFTKGRSGMERLYAESVDLSLRGVFQSSSSVQTGIIIWLDCMCLSGSFWGACSWELSDARFRLLAIQASCWSACQVPLHQPRVDHHICFQKVAHLYNLDRMFAKCEFEFTEGSRVGSISPKDHNVHL